MRTRRIARKLLTLAIRSMAGWSHHWAGFGDLFDDLGSRELWEVLRHVDPIYQPWRFNHTVLMLRAGNDEASGKPKLTYFCSYFSSRRDLRLLRENEQKPKNLPALVAELVARN